MGICNGFEKEIVSDEFKDLYMKMVSPEPDKRLTIKKILEHPWLQSAGDIDEKLRKEFRRRIPKIEDEIKKEISEMKDDNLTLFGNKLILEQQKMEINLNLILIKSLKIFLIIIMIDLVLYLK
jgi:serine/threonine protein kinase